MKSKQMSWNSIHTIICSSTRFPLTRWIQNAKIEKDIVFLMAIQPNAVRSIFPLIADSDCDGWIFNIHLYILKFYWRKNIAKCYDSKRPLTFNFSFFAFVDLKQRIREGDSHNKSSKTKCSIPHIIEFFEMYQNRFPSFQSSQAIFHSCCGRDDGVFVFDSPKVHFQFTKIAFVVRLSRKALKKWLWIASHRARFFSTNSRVNSSGIT